MILNRDTHTGHDIHETRANWQQCTIH